MMMKPSALIRALLPAAFGLLTACAPLVKPVIDHRGYVPDEAQLAAVKPGVDTKSSVVSQLGTPSAEANFDGDTWYYISTEQRSFLYNRPKITKEQVVAIRFDGNNVVSEINQYDFKDHRDINYVKRETPTRGKELTLLQQLLGNVGRISTESEAETPRGNAP
jgi:outer membrane protein assembly factor BamE (lipoprotein component of BamABCDE complex)